MNAHKEHEIELKPYKHQSSLSSSNSKEGDGSKNSVKEEEVMIDNFETSLKISSYNTLNQDGKK